MNLFICAKVKGKIKLKKGNNYSGINFVILIRCWLVMKLTHHNKSCRSPNSEKN